MTRLHQAKTPLTAYFWSGDLLRSRSVSDVILFGHIDIPAPPAQLLADWVRDAACLALEPGDVEALTLARTRARWADYKHCVQAMADWTRVQGLAGPDEDVLADSEVALMVCHGARYHFDAAQYGGAAFCNLFLSEAKDLDLHFPLTGLRLPLQRGMAVVFDTGQPHAVVPRGRADFDAADFESGQDCNQFFITWELAVENPRVSQALQISLVTNPATALPLKEAQVQLHGERVDVDPATGHWSLRA